MTHQDALREMSAERYLLGELGGESRDLFEEHLFDCPLCAADVTSGVTFLEGARAELLVPPKAQSSSRKRSWLRPMWLVPALAASLLAIVYQAGVVEPALKHQLAQADSPAILNNLVLTSGATRGGPVEHISAPEHGSFLLSVDMPTDPATQNTYSSYLCSLYSPAGIMFWQGSVSHQQANDAVLIRVPTAVTRAGENTLLVQGVRQESASGAKLVDLARHAFVLELSK